MINGFDHYLTYWLLVWVVVYILLNWCVHKCRSVFLGTELKNSMERRLCRGITQNTYIKFFIRNCNPLIIIVIALGVSIYALIILIQRRAKSIIIFLYILIIIFKAIPIYFLMKFAIHPIPNILYAIVFIITYELYLRAIGHDMLSIYTNEINDIMEGNTPFIRIMLNFLT